MGEDYAETLNAGRDGWCTAMGVRFVRVTLDEVVAELDVDERHRQAYGIVHGGVHSGLIETLASVGAALNALKDGRSAVGLENHTSFLAAVREGKLIAKAVPITRGKRSQVWETTVATDGGKLAAKGTVRIICLEPRS
jgi:uncharacterized protein (TIGR00369 family)